MPGQDTVALNLAAAALSGAWSIPSMARRAAEAWGQKDRCLRGLMRRIIAAFAADAPRPALSTLAEFIAADVPFRQAYHRSSRGRHGFPLRRVFSIPHTMAPAAGAPASWNLPPLTTPEALAALLGVDRRELDWFADCQRRNRRAEAKALHHYTYRWLLTRKGKARLLEVPKARLKDIQRRLLHELLDNIPPHEAAHGYRVGRSIASYVRPHAGRAVVLHFDLCRFFTSIGAGRVRAVFRTAGYPPAVAWLLAGLCTNAVPADVLGTRPANARRPRGSDDHVFLSPHLPQGAPTSPALANLCVYRLDCRLDGLSRAVGARYTRYADDLVFSGDEALERSIRRFHVLVCRIALEEGFEINTRKSHFMRQGVRQQVAGIVLNARPNLPREDFDRLKAILTNCVRHGPESQNRDGHADFRAFLAGRISYVTMIHPARGRRLRDLFERIAWTGGPPGPT
jgi:RNA-directed DNA polymerase